MSDSTTASQSPSDLIIWVAAITLSQRESSKMVLTQTLSWRSNCTENEARGAAVVYAQESKPGFSIELITMAKIELPSLHELQSAH
jgi:hypothetical protein